MTKRQRQKKILYQVAVSVSGYISRKAKPLSPNLLSEILLHHGNELLIDWLQLQKESLGGSRERLPESQTRTQSHDFLMTLRDSLAAGAGSDLHEAKWAKMRELLGDLSRQGALQGLSVSETATFVFSFKQRGADST